MTKHLEELRTLMFAESSDITEKYVELEMEMLCSDDCSSVWSLKLKMDELLVRFANERMYSLNTRNLPIDNFSISDTSISYAIDQYNIDISGRFSDINEWAEAVLELHELIRTGNKEAIGYFIEELR